MNMILERQNKGETRQFELLEDPGDLLSDLNTYIPKLLNYLWDLPKLVAAIIEKADLTDIYYCFAPLFTNNFYENILSSKYLEDNLMYVITLLLNNEIQKLTNINQYDTFLDETRCGYILGELRKQHDIQTFFKNIISDSIENLEINYSSTIINFCVNDLNEQFINKNLTNKKKMDEEFMRYKNEAQSGESMSLEDTNMLRNKKRMKAEQENFNVKYIPTLDKTALKAKYDEFKDNKKMHDFLYIKLNDCNTNTNLYSNSKIFSPIITCLSK